MVEVWVVEGTRIVEEMLVEEIGSSHINFCFFPIIMLSLSTVQK